MNDAQLRQRYRAYWRRWDELKESYDKKMEAWWAIPWPARKCIPEPPWPNLPFPEELRGLTCGAKTRKGTPCKRRDLYSNGRCPLHGGLSTGPRTEEGKRRSAKNGFKRVARKRPEDVLGLNRAFDKSTAVLSCSIEQRKSDT
jgi:hypothetical protein